MFSFYEVTPEEKKSLIEHYESTTSTLQKPKYPDWKNRTDPILPVAPELYRGCLFDQYMNRSKFKISANGGKICCAIYGKPSDIFGGIRTTFKGFIVLTNESENDFFVDKFTELGLLIFGY
jgi:hypothetical protein